MIACDVHVTIDFSKIILKTGVFKPNEEMTLNVTSNDCEVNIVGLKIGPDPRVRVILQPPVK